MTATMPAPKKTAVDWQAEYAAKVRRIANGPVYDNEEAGGFQSVARILSLVRNLRPDRAPEALEAHKALVREIRRDVLELATTWPEHVKLLVELHNYLNACGYEWRDRGWVHRDSPEWAEIVNRAHRAVTA